MNTKITKQLLLTMVALMLTACSDFLPNQNYYSDSKGHNATVLLNISTAPLLEQGEKKTGTRAIKPGTVNEGTEPGYQVNDFWLLEYGADGKLLTDKGEPVVKYITMRDLALNKQKFDIQVPAKNSNDTYKCVMIANTHNPSFFNTSDISQYNTLDKLKELTKDITSFDDDTYNKTGGTNDLYLSCVVEVKGIPTTLNCEFSRNVAKLTFKLRNMDNSGMEITGIQICNVPNKIAYADCLYKNTEAIAYDANIIDMPKENIQLKPGEETTRLYYLPRNCQGEDNNISNTNERNSSTMANSATHVKVFANTKDKERTIFYCYTFYIGSDMKKDFNVTPNCHYPIDANISDHGDENTDYRVEDMTPMGANCIMMDLEKKDNIYTIYPYKRINKFWGKVMKDPTRIINDNYEWEATIIWQDIPKYNVIEFVDPKTGKGKGESYTCKGKQALNIKLGSSAKTPCNVVIGVRKKGASLDFGFLWSWHLWITNYNPNVNEATKPWIQDKYEYKVQNGSIFHYEIGATNSDYNTLWELNGKYGNKYIMDRNLGATTERKPTLNDGLSKNRLTFGLQYQFGRKDPFLIGVYATQYNGNSLFASNVKVSKQAVSIDKSVKRPNVFYAFEPDWVISNNFVGNDWNNPFHSNDPSEKKFKNKSFFDPCPEGWCVPQKGTWNVFQKTVVKSTNGNNNPSLRPNITNAKHEGSFGYGLMFTIGKGTSTFYPATGFRAPHDGVSYCEFEYIGCWSSSHYDSKYGFAFEYSTTYNYFFPLNYDARRGYGLTVRCVQE